VGDDDVPRDPPFTLNGNTGQIKTTMAMTFTETKTWRFQVKAKDNPGQTTQQNSIDGEVIVCLFL